MRAKRSKKYRKIMHTYQLHFSFREPYQVLLSSSFLRAAYAFHMPLQQFIENTLHGKMTAYITQCTLARVMQGYSGRGKGGRPDYLPPPTEIPLRYCKHKDSEGHERGIIPEGQCLVDLISGQPKGNEAKKNKQHYILAAADWDEGLKDDEERQKLQKLQNERKDQGEADIDPRGYARIIPAVPIIYLKRSVMILEEPSVATERAIRGTEKEKFTEGLSGAVRGLKRKRGDEETVTEPVAQKTTAKKKTKEPNPLSMKKKQSKPPQEHAHSKQKVEANDDTSKHKRRGKRGKKGKPESGGTATAEGHDL